MASAIRLGSSLLSSAYAEVSHFAHSEDRVSLVVKHAFVSYGLACACGLSNPLGAVAITVIGIHLISPCIRENGSKVMGTPFGISAVLLIVLQVFVTQKVYALVMPLFGTQFAAAIATSLATGPLWELAAFSCGTAIIERIVSGLFNNLLDPIFLGNP